MNVERTRHLITGEGHCQGGGMTTDERQELLTGGLLTDASGELAITSKGRAYLVMTAPAPRPLRAMLRSL